MCGRFTLATSVDTLAQAFALSERPQSPPRYNIAPGQPILVIRQTADGCRIAALLSWGLIPAWVKDPVGSRRPINARGETAAEKPSFRAAFRQRRCLVPADGFYEWQARAGGKQPFYFRVVGGKPFAMAGLWERWQGDNGERIDSVALLTTDANAIVAPVHDRMPVILPPSDYGQWLDPGEADSGQLQAMIKAFPARDMEAWPVAATVNRPINDGPGCIEPSRAGVNGELSL
jgi:putative SOS response-associated peptidase YedK